MLWSCWAVIEGFLLTWILITLCCQFVTTSFLVPVPGSLSLGNAIGRAKSPEDDIPHELKLKNLQIADLLKPIMLPISAILWFALGYAKICVLWVSLNWPLVINKSYVLPQRTIDPSNKTAILIQIWAFLVSILLAKVSKYFWTPSA